MNQDKMNEDKLMYPEHQNELLISQLFDSQPDSVVWFIPVFSDLDRSKQDLPSMLSTSSHTNLDSNQHSDLQHKPFPDRTVHQFNISIDRTDSADKTESAGVTDILVGNDLRIVTDFQVAYCNAAACRILNANREQVLHSSVLETPLMDPVSRSRIFEQCLQVWNSGEHSEFTYHSPLLDRYFNVQRSKVNNGVLSITRDRTELVKAQMEKERQTQLLNNLLEHSPYGAALYESVRDTKGEIVDFRMKIGNRKCSEITGFTLEELYTYSVRELIALRQGTSHFFDICRQVVEQDKTEYLEYYSIHLKKWIAYSFVKFADGYLLNYIDISQTKLQEQINQQQTLLLDSILDASQNGIFAYQAVRDRDGEMVDFEIIKVNKSFSRILGISQQAAEGKKYSTVFPGILDSELFQINCQVLQSGKAAQTEFYYKRDAFQGWFHLSIAPLGENGLVQTFIDITESRRDKLSLEASAIQLQTVIDSTQTGIFLAKPVWSQEGTIIDFRFKTVNKALASYASSPINQLIGRLHGECFPVYFSNGVFEKYCQVWLTREPIRFEQNYLTEEFDVWMDVSARKLDEDLLVTFHDFTSVKKLQQQQEHLLTDLKHSNEDLLEANQLLARSNENLEQFASIASHDLQEPLRKVQSFGNLLQSQYGAQLGEGIQFLQRMQSAANRMSILIRDLLTFSKISTQKDSLAPVPLNQVINSVLIELELLMEETQARIQVDPLPVIEGDASQLAQLFQNLLSNALKFHKPDVAPFIEVKYQLISASALPIAGRINRNSKQYLQHYHRIEVSDNGIGFEPAYAERIFQMFQRLHSKQEYSGTGIGLAICEKVVTNHGGTIMASSELGKGATFTLFFPAF
ncbi:ATP-binding protein [Xanthocytophaga agilis]|uniref:histidine kinase n=1 Tax=Xanthocytophaga agilis TaxID=3048010 RepID=A0AAE3RC99_9BACT|nr:ATP-binding protein [Xanthocytophaga agilis]MDJ1505782.1 ATP-binding protein [Xanthocytophaga agilis]